jgi:hypothetical protein
VEQVRRAHAEAGDDALERASLPANQPDALFGVIVVEGQRRALVAAVRRCGTARVPPSAIAAPLGARDDGS